MLSNFQAIRRSLVPGPHQTFIYSRASVPCSFILQEEGGGHCKIEYFNLYLCDCNLFGPYCLCKCLFLTSRSPQFSSVYDALRCLAWPHRSFSHFKHKMQVRIRRFIFVLNFLRALSLLYTYVNILRTSWMWYLALRTVAWTSRNV